MKSVDSSQPLITCCDKWKERYSHGESPSDHIVTLKEATLNAIRTYSVFLKGNPFYGTDSFGKDSSVVCDLLIKSGIPFDSHHNITTCDPPELIRFGLTHHKLTTVHLPKTSMMKLIEHKGVPPTRMAPYCCDHLKERGGSGRFVVTGIRHEESPKRAKRQKFENCYNDISKKYFHPIIDWTEDDVWEYIHAFKIPYCSLYDEGWTRIGCVLCPKSSLKNRLRELYRYPKRAKSYLKCFRRALLIPHPTHKIQYQSEYDMLCWWIFGKFLRDVSNEKALIIMQVGD